jgi:ADP-heptose:LPS heptosyltransferase
LYSPSSSESSERPRILVIRLGALGDLVLCFQAFAEIRAAHPGAEIALLTMPAFAGFAASMPWFDHVLIDARAPAGDIGGWFTLLRSIRTFKPTRVYDLQGKARQDILYTLLGGPFGPEWSGAAPFCKYPRPWPPKTDMHFTDFIAAQLRKANVPAAQAPNLGWCDAPLDDFKLPERFALLIPGCGPGRDYKRWPHYAELAKELQKRGLGTVAIGTAAEADIASALTREVPNLVDLTGRTSLPQVAALTRKATYVIGNDTGPTHLAAAVGARTLALMPGEVDPLWSAPRGPRSRWLQGKPLASLAVREVLLALGELPDKTG